ncbi:MAG: glycosyltransferase [Proteobacteria bacterium]|nr:glycosyltransferase [Pseudomonadota bacterium]
MKIMFLARSLDGGGAERQLVTLAVGLRKRGHEVAIAVFYPGGEFETQARNAGVAILPLGKRGRWDVVGFAWRLLKTLRAARPDILHGYLATANLLAVLARPFLPKTRTVLGIRASNMALDRYDWLMRLIGRLEALFASPADLVIANSEAGRDHAVARGFPGDKMAVVPNGIDTQFFRPDPAASPRLRADLGIGSEGRLIGLVARLDPMKDHPTFLRAVAEFLESGGRARFICVGDGPRAYRESLQTLGRELGIDANLSWAGSRDDMPSVYNALDVLTLTSAFGEGFPNVLGEAMACGVPCVATDVGDVKRVLGEAGIVVAPGDPGALARAWVTILRRFETEDGTLGQETRRRIVTHFSAETMVARTEALLGGLLDQARTGPKDVN